MPATTRLEIVCLHRICEIWIRINLFTYLEEKCPLHPFVEPVTAYLCRISVNDSSEDSNIYLQTGNIWGQGIYRGMTTFWTIIWLYLYGECRSVCLGVSLKCHPAFLGGYGKRRSACLVVSGKCHPTCMGVCVGILMTCCSWAWTRLVLFLYFYETCTFLRGMERLHQCTPMRSTCDPYDRQNDVAHRLHAMSLVCSIDLLTLPSCMRYPGNVVIIWPANHDWNEPNR